MLFDLVMHVYVIAHQTRLILQCILAQVKCIQNIHPFHVFFTSSNITNQYSKASFNISGNMCHDFNPGEMYVYFHLLFLHGSPNHAIFGSFSLNVRQRGLLSKNNRQVDRFTNDLGKQTKTFSLTTLDGVKTFSK